MSLCFLLLMCRTVNNILWQYDSFVPVRLRHAVRLSVDVLQMVYL